MTGDISYEIKISPFQTYFSFCVNFTQIGAIYLRSSGYDGKKLCDIMTILVTEFQ